MKPSKLQRFRGSGSDEGRHDPTDEVPSCISEAQCLDLASAVHRRLRELGLKVANADLDAGSCRPEHSGLSWPRNTS